MNGVSVGHNSVTLNTVNPLTSSHPVFYYPKGIQNYIWRPVNQEMNILIAGWGGFRRREISKSWHFLHKPHYWV